MKFLIQKINRKVKHDFSLSLIDSIEYQKFMNTSNHKVKFSNYFIFDKYPRYIPIGSVEFVLAYFNQYFPHIKLLPMNIPNQLLNEKYTQRKVYNDFNPSLKPNKFVKSMDVIKADPIIVDKPMDLVGNYQISEYINIDSEFRFFVFKGKVVGLQHYLGNFTIFPNIDIVLEMIKVFENQPIAFTLDVGINKNGTFVIECHDFFSCGFYGFNDMRNIPQMFSQWFFEKTRL